MRVRLTTAYNIPLGRSMCFQAIVCLPPQHIWTTGLGCPSAASKRVRAILLSGAPSFPGTPTIKGFVDHASTALALLPGPCTAFRQSTL